MLRFNDNGPFVTLEYCLPKFNPKAVWVDFATDKNKPIITFYEILQELESFSRVYGDCAIKHAVIQIKGDIDRIMLKNHYGLKFRSYVDYLHENYMEFEYFVEKCVIELIKPLICQVNDKIKNDVKELQKEIDIIYNELDMLRAKSKKKNKSKRRLISGKKRHAVFARDNYRCQICGATVDDGAKLHVDHILPVSKGGTNDITNLQILCEKCNLGKHNRTDLPHDKRKLKELRELYKY